MSTQSYDIIGDIHGQAGKLTALLARLGYSEASGPFRHSERRAVFVGDFIDRGPAVRETLQIVRRMVDSGTALAVMGNHELIALEHLYAQQSPGDVTPGRRQFLEAVLRRSLEDFASCPSEWIEALEWFRRLPVFLDLGDLRVVHAAWNEAAIALLDGHRTLEAIPPETLFTRTAVSGTVRTLLYGWQVRHPAPERGLDLETGVATTLRLAWWKRQDAPTYRSLSFPFDIAAPEEPVPADMVAQLPGYPAEAPALFFGHYAQSPDERPWPLAANVACLDYRAAKGGPLVAYRWDGEQVLDPAKFVF